MVMESGKRTEYVTPAVSRYGFRERHTEKLERRTTMAEYIDKEACLSILREKANMAVLMDAAPYFEKAAQMLEKLPAADVAPVVHGVWVCVNKIDPISGYRCSKCRRIVGFDLTPYCPNCGAKMDGGDNDAAD
jgi:hypothetical protein